MAVAYGQQASRISNELHIGEVYFFKNVGFEHADMPPAFRLAISSEYYLLMYSRTEIRPAEPNISIPIIPSRFMDFSVAAKLRNKYLVGK